MKAPLRNVLIEVAVVVVLVGHLVAFLVLRADQRAHDDAAREIAAWMHEHGETSVAWPEELRGAVPALLDAGVTPVLVAEEPAAQDLAVNDTAVVVTREPTPLEDLAMETFETGRLHVAHIDLDRASVTPLEVGEVVGEQISRPYRYGPLRDSLAITPDEPFAIDLRLAPGRYALSVEAFDPNQGTELRLTVEAESGNLIEETWNLQPAVLEPLAAEFDTTGDREASVTLVFRSLPDAGGGPSLLHAWWLERLEDRP